MRSVRFQDTTIICIRYMHSLTVGPTGHLHLVYQFHYGDTGRADDCKGRAAIYMRSEDGGDTWLHEDGSTASLPVTIDSMKPVVHFPKGGPGLHYLRVANNVVDELDRVWFFCSVVDNEGGVIFRREGDAWSRIELGGMTGGMDLSGGRSSSLSRGPGGHMHLLVSTRPGGEASSWYDAGNEVFHLEMDSEGAFKDFRQLTETDPAAAQWLPALVNWDWTRPTASCLGGHWFTYTRGTNEGGIGGDNRSPLKTEVYLSRLSPKSNI